MACKKGPWLDTNWACSLDHKATRYKFQWTDHYNMPDLTEISDIPKIATINIKLMAGQLCERAFKSFCGKEC